MKHLTILISLLIGFNYFGYGQEDTPPLSCTDCHSALIEHEVVHEVAADDCETCHVSNGNDHPRVSTSGFDLMDVMPDLCYYCHEEPTKSMQHAPAEMGECVMCHSPHGSPNKSLLLNSPQTALCAECHDMSMTEKQFKHEPVVKGTCASCHDPHQSDNSYLLTQEKQQLCKNCHTNERMQAEMEYIHYPFEDDCSNCHESHSADNDKLLMQKTPELCYNCHDMESALLEAKTVHKVINDDKSCANCHSPHASNQALFLIKAEKEMCLDCHSGEIKTEERTIANIGKSLKEGNHIHGVIESDGCIICHSPHYSDYPMLLSGAFPTEEYTTTSMESFDLCFLCHDYSMLEEETTDWATEFRDGDRNMHSLHINGEKGRNCNLCHDIHGSPNEHMIANKVQFGNWEMPVDYKADGNGGSCSTGCHGEKSYSRLGTLSD